MKIRIQVGRLGVKHFFMSVLYLVFVNFDLLNSNPGFTLAPRPLIFVKMVANREQSRKTTENRENVHLIV